MADAALDAGLERLHGVVIAKLGRDSAVEKVAAEVGETGEAGLRTQARVRLALEEAVEEDSAFAAALEEAVARVRAAQGEGAGVSAADQGVAVAGGVRADRGGIAIGGVTGGSISVGERPDPRPPGQS